jgi:hypothetical protein
MFGTTEEFSLQLGFWWPYWEKTMLLRKKLIHNSTLLLMWKNGIRQFYFPRRKRLPIGQGQEAFQAAQLRGIKSRFLFSRRKSLGLNHKTQVWQRFLNG